MAVNKQTLEALDLFSKIPIGISSVILIIHVVAPLFGDVFLSKALVIHGGDIAFWFCIKYFIKSTKQVAHLRQMHRNVYFTEMSTYLVNQPFHLTTYTSCTA